MKKYIFLILASNDPIHEMDLASQKRTWVRDIQENVSVIWIRGSRFESAVFANSTLYLPCPETFENILLKTVLAINWVLDNLEFDIMIRTNISTYFNLRKLDEEFIGVSPSEDYFGGYPSFSKQFQFENGQPFEFVSGTGIYLSRKTALKIAKLEPEKYVGVADDVALTHFAKLNSIAITPHLRNNLQSTHIFKDSFQIRLKSSIESSLASKRFDLIWQFHRSGNFFQKIGSILAIVCFELKSIHIRNFREYFIRNFHLLRVYVDVKRRFSKNV